MPSRRLMLTGLAASALAAPRIAHAAWPGDRPIEIIVPFPPGNCA